MRALIYRKKSARKIEEGGNGASGCWFHVEIEVYCRGVYFISRLKARSRKKVYSRVICRDVILSFGERKIVSIFLRLPNDPSTTVIEEFVLEKYQ